MKRIGAGAVVAVLVCTRAAAAAPAKAPVLGWTIDLAAGWSITTDQQHIKDDAGNNAVDLPPTDLLTLSPAVTIDLERTTGQCFDELAMMAAVIKLTGTRAAVRGTDVPADWFPIEEHDVVSDAERARGVVAVTTYCRDLFEAGYLRVIVQSDGGHQADLVAAYGAIEAAIKTQVSAKVPAYGDTPQALLDQVGKDEGELGDHDAPAADPPAAVDPAPASASASPEPDSAYVPPAPSDDSAYVPPASTDATAHDDGDPASYDTARWSLAGGQSQLDAGMGTHVYGAARVAITPRYLDDDEDDGGFAFAAGASAGAAGDAFVGDSYASLGYGTGGGTLTARALLALGVDRVGGGFEPQVGAYGGLQGFVRVGFGSFAVEGDGMVTRSTGVDETRAQLGVITHVGDRVLAIGGFYTRWDAVASIYGVSIGLTR